MLFDEKTRQYLPPRTRGGHIRDLLLALEGAYPAGRHGARARAGGRSARSPSGACLIVVFSDLLDAPADLGDRLRQLRSRGNDVVVFHLLDPDEVELPYDDLTDFEGMEPERRAAPAGRSARSGGVVQARIGGAARALAAGVPGGARRVPVRDHGGAARRGAARLPVRPAADAAVTAMNFLAPALLLGLVAAVLPWLIHRIGRRRARPVRFAAMELLLRAEREVSARRRLRDVALLIARTGLAIALPLAFARPFAEVRSDLPAVTARSQSAVLVLDDSASMRRQRARAATPCSSWRGRGAQAVVEHLSPDSEVAIVLASEASAAPLAELSSDRARVLATLAGIAATARRADFGAALRRASQILTSSPRADRLIYVVTDLQAAGWEDVTPAALAAGPETVLLDVSGGEPWPNRAVIGLAAEPAPEEGAQGIAVVAEIANYAAEPAHALGITLRLDGAEVARGFVDIPAGGRARKRFVHTVSTGQRAPGGGGDRPRQLHARRPARLPRRGVARPARAAGRRRSAHGAHRRRGVLPGGGAARRRLRLRGHHRVARRRRQPRPGHLRRGVHGQRREADRGGRGGASPATSKPAAACSSRSATASTPTPGTRR